MKTCTGCGTTKTVDQYHADKRRKDGKLARCKDCRRIETNAYRKRVGYDRIRYRRTAPQERERHLIRKYGVTQADYDHMLSAQGGGCAICSRKQNHALDVDHCHATGNVRGLLCTNCNRLLGHAHDDIARLIAAARYLISSRKETRK